MQNGNERTVELIPEKAVQTVKHHKNINKIDSSGISQDKYSKTLLSSTFKVKKRNQDYLFLLVAHAIPYSLSTSLTHFYVFHSLQR